MWGKLGALGGAAGSAGVVWWAAAVAAKTALAAGATVTAPVSIPAMAGAAVLGAIFFGTMGRTVGYFIKQEDKRLKIKDKKLEELLLRAKNDIERVNLAQQAQAHQNNMINSLSNNIHKNCQDAQEYKDFFEGKKPMPEGESKESLKVKYNQKLAEADAMSIQMRNAQAASAIMTQVIQNPSNFSLKSKWLKKARTISITLLIFMISIAIFVSFSGKIINLTVRLFNWIISFGDTDEKKKNKDEIIAEVVKEVKAKESKKPIRKIDI